ncbi:hypothetical protein [uncultured Thiocystis sp.]|jgi:hypothetical protein|uniref:hypothetical protein n=1 Tax=uncultured Thiocystis sp. TaxID=1202134 RepID=UPI0025F8F41E|nr:hypothetical protein [uncultured Thiocystis sp.]
MPILPAPITVGCPACGWSKTVAPRSDALMPGEYFDACPACGHAPLTRRSSLANPLGLLSAALRGLAGNR